MTLKACSDLKTCKTDFPHFAWISENIVNSHKVWVECVGYKLVRCKRSQKVQFFKILDDILMKSVFRSDNL